MKEDKVHYSAVRKKFLKEHPIDEIALAVTGEIIPSTIIHHSHGRRSRYKWDETYFIATTRYFDKWAHKLSNRKLAIELGFLFPDYNPHLNKRFNKHFPDNKITITEV